MNTVAWRADTDWQTVCKRAAGRRRYNAWRQLLALMRRREVARLLWDYDSMFRRGIRQDIAARLGVHPSTVSRDIKAILEALNWGYCPCCGAWARRPMPGLDDGP